ncbi:MAG: hypothetical protein QXG84_07990 [Ignisphaera sp.]
MKGEELVEALKMRALPEGSDDYDALIEFLKLYRDAVQLVVNKLWNLESRKTLEKYIKLLKLLPARWSELKNAMNINSKHSTT